jgi:hypothetical protein
MAHAPLSGGPVSRLFVLALAGPLAAPLAAQVPDALLGIWKGVDVPAEFADRATGAGIALSGWFGQLKLRADGGYELEEYREGALGGCRVSILQRSSGAARADGAVLTLAPARGVETKRDACNTSRSYADRPFGPRTERFTVALSWTETLAGWLTLKLVMTAHDREGERYVVEGVHDPQAPWPEVALSPERGHAPPAALPDLWHWPARVPPTFRPGSGTFAPPPEDAMWLRLSADGRYEWAGWRENLVPGPGCSRDVLVYERGRYALTAAEYSWQQTLTTTPEEGVVIERLSDCGTDDGERRSPLPLAPSQYQWSLGRSVDGEEVLELKCPGEYSRRTKWQFALCHWGYEFRVLLSRAR